MNALPSLKFEPHAGFGENDPDGNPWPLGFITAAFPIFELQVVFDHPKQIEIAKAMAASPDLLTAVDWIIRLYDAGEPLGIEVITRARAARDKARGEGR